MGHFAAVNQADLIFRIKSIIGSRIPAQGPAFSFGLGRDRIIKNVYGAEFSVLVERVIPANEIEDNWK